MGEHDIMPRIRILDAGTVCRIAAGEVVERPASVVKELVENSIDASASTIIVEILTKSGRIESIQVTDNGLGMTLEEARLSFLRHATSKITAIEDLASCRSLGFRGEALASIASVARVEMITKERRPGIQEGVRIVNLGGTIIEERVTGSPEGTSVLVRDLFFNTPARKKFQKSLSAELAYISGLVERMAVAHPSISFQLRYNGKEKISSVGNGKLLDAVISVYGTEMEGNMVPIDEEGDLVKLDGYLSRPDLTRQNPYQMMLSVNNRTIHSKRLIEAIREGYGTLIPSDRYPVVFLNIIVAGSLIDVNVHPSKKEIRMSREQEITGEITALVRNSLMKGDLVHGTLGRGAVWKPSPWKGAESARYSIPPPSPCGVREPYLRELAATDRQLRLTEAGLPPGYHHSALPAMEVIGQLASTYILVRSGEGDLLLIDQHAAHERILYDQVAARSAAGNISQELLEPVIFHLTPQESIVLSHAIPVLNQEGFAIEEFGKAAYAVRAVPVILGKNVETGLVQEIVSGLLSEEARKGIDPREAVKRIIACHGAIKAGTPCTDEQCSTLVSQLRRTVSPYTCPHGRPTMIRISKRQLDDLFKRT